ncbi:hypothetical protein J2X24_002148 [Asticcacaulis solisilvae]|nr:hypothetical protein [Asticcacaulis solisilvae]MDR6800592.1 hypothetical protein [Asticcacaulis sp. BE141]
MLTLFFDGVQGKPNTSPPATDRGGNSLFEMANDDIVNPLVAVKTQEMVKIHDSALSPTIGA